MTPANRNNFTQTSHLNTLIAVMLNKLPARPATVAKPDSYRSEILMRAKLFVHFT